MRSQAALEWQRRKEAGLPTFPCPRCKKPEAHWEPATLDESGDPTPGRYICEPVQTVEQPALDLEGLSAVSELSVITPLPISPDCRDGNKHRACTGSAWDFTTDTETVCLCSCHQIGEAA